MNSAGRCPGAYGLTAVSAFTMRPMIRPTCVPRLVNATITAAPTRPPAIAYSTVVRPSSLRRNARSFALMIFAFIVVVPDSIVDDCLITFPARAPGGAIDQTRHAIRQVTAICDGTRWCDQEFL